MTDSVQLTQYSHGAGCGCKISPSVLSTIVASQLPAFSDPNLLVGNDTRDDAAVYQINEQQSVVSTTDFFMPIVDDPHEFGRIAATNAMSDIYAMGATPIMAIAILGWPLDKLSPEIAQQVVDGGRAACHDAGIALAGGHSIDSPEPIFGLAVTGLLPTEHLKTNAGGQVGDHLFLTKPLGVGIYTTAQKKGLLTQTDRQQVVDLMCELNKVGTAFSKIPGVHAMTDVTGFGLAGHLLEVCDAANLSAHLHGSQLPQLPQVASYIEQGCVPGGVGRNFASYGKRLPPLNDYWKTLLCDPQTSGGLLVAVSDEDKQPFIDAAQQQGVDAYPIGQLVEQNAQTIVWSDD